MNLKKIDEKTYLTLDNVTIGPNNIKVPIDKFKNLTAFVGIFPVAAPQYIILIVLDEPKGTEDTYGLRTAAWNAVPTAGKILDSILPLLFE